MPRIDIPPTKSNLRKIKNDLTFAYEGYDLLGQKREILVMEIMKNVSMIKEIEENMKHLLRDLYNSYKIAALDMGSEKLSEKSQSEPENYTLEINYGKFMGISMPSIQLTREKRQKPVNLYGTRASYDDVKKYGDPLPELLSDYAAITKTIVSLSRELKKVQRKVNALEKIFIPQNEATKKYISDRLEEMEREELFVKKMIQDRS